MVVPQRIRLLLVDDHSVIRMGLVTLLELQEGFSVVAEAEDGEQAVIQYRSVQPDVVLMDVRMPKMDGVDALKAIRMEWPEARVMILTTSEVEDDIQRAIDAGACGYITKSVKPAELYKAIAQVHAGGTFIPESIRDRLDLYLKQKRLTHREMEVLQAMRRGLTNRDIAALLGFTEHTAKAHVKAILDKLASADRTEAVARGFELGLLRPNIKMAEHT
jgi:DNA-binding NarL/FixJ family response regulator